MAKKKSHVAEDRPRAGSRTGGLYPLETHAFSCIKGKPHVQKRAHWHNDVELNLLTGGTVTYLWHGRVETIPSPSVVLFWAGMPHQVIEVEGSAKCYWMYVTLTSFLEWELPTRFTKRSAPSRRKWVCESRCLWTRFCAIPIARPAASRNAKPCRTDSFAAPSTAAAA